MLSGDLARVAGEVGQSGGNGGVLVCDVLVVGWCEQEG